MEATPFLISDESINRYGFRVLTKGIRIDNFLKNPVGLFMHLRADDDKNPVLPICRWENLVKHEDGRFTGNAIFDSDDPFARTIANKVKNNFIRAVSMGINIKDMSEDPALMFPGQTLPTVTESELTEISIADIGSNTNSVKLYYNMQPTTLLEAKLNIGSTSQNEYEQLFRNGGLEKLKNENPTKFNLLRSEYLSKISASKSASEPAVKELSSLTWSEISEGHSLFNQLWKSNKLGELKSASPNNYEHILKCFKAYVKA